MKKILSLILCIILVCSIGSWSVSAATNYCKLFEDNIRSLRWSLNFNGDKSVAENTSFPIEVIMDYIKMKTMFTYTEDNQEFVSIPASVFETKAKKCFALIDLNAMRSFEEDYWNSTTQAMDKRKVYDSTKKAYVFFAAGGVGDSTTYAIRGYSKNGNKYTVYSHFIDLSEPNDTTAGEGMDYFVYEGDKYKIYHTVKNVVETDGTDVKFHSWEKVSSYPAESSLITVSTKLEDEKPAQSKPSGSSSNTSSASKPTQSTTTSSTAIQSKPTASSSTSTTVESNQSTTSQTGSETPVSSEETTSSEVEKPLVTVATTETAKLETEANVFPEKTVVKVEEIKETKTIETIKTALKDITENFVAYEITAKCDNVSVQPDGKVKATFNIPEGYDLEKVAVFYVADDGKTEKLNSSVDKATNTIIAELEHFSTYVVAETNIVSSESTEESTTETTGEAEPKPAKNNAVLWIVIIVVLVAALGAVLYFFVIKKKA